MKLAKRGDSGWLAEERDLLAATRRLIVEDGLDNHKDASLPVLLLRMRARSRNHRTRHHARASIVGAD
jgi:hypothetical protein